MKFFSLITVREFHARIFCAALSLGDSEVWTCLLGSSKPLSRAPVKAGADPPFGPSVEGRYTISLSPRPVPRRSNCHDNGLIRPVCVISQTLSF